MVRDYLLPPQPLQALSFPSPQCRPHVLPQCLSVMSYRGVFPHGGAMASSPA